MKEEKLDIRYTNRNALTEEKLRELKEDISSTVLPDIIAITKLNPKYYTEELSEVEYKLTCYSLEHKNFKVHPQYCIYFYLCITARDKTNNNSLDSEFTWRLRGSQKYEFFMKLLPKRKANTI